MRFNIIWYEYHDPLNWGNTTENGIKEMYRLLPTKDIHLDPNEDDGWVECNCADEFEADSIEEAKKYVIDNYDIPSEVFTVFSGDNYADAVFTEEDL